MSNRLTYNEVKDFLLNKGLILLSDEYKNNKEKLLIKCSCGKEFERCFQDIKNKNMYKCEFCSGNRLSYEYVYGFIKLNGCELLSKKYKNNSTKLDIRCECGHIYKVDFNTFKKGQTRCKNCYWKINKHHNALDFNIIEKHIQNKSNCTILSKEYNGVHEKLKLLCHCGREFSTNFANIQKMKTIQCLKCTNEQSAQKMRRDWEDVKEELENIMNGKYKILECNYKNVHSKVKLKHIECGHVFNRAISGIRFTDNKCPFCENKIRLKTVDEVQIDINKLCDGFEVVEYVNSSEIYLKHVECGHIFKKRWSTIRESQGTVCPECNPMDSVGVLAIIDYLDNNNIKYTREKTFEGCVHIRKLFFDFYLTDYNACIEFDGLQHFRSSRRLGGEENFKLTQKRDKIKNEFCEKNNIPLKRIKYNQVSKINSIIEDYINKLIPR